MSLRCLLFAFALAHLASCHSSDLQAPPGHRSSPVVEIFQDAQGAYEVYGNSLFFRMYDDGLAQFEVADPAKLSGGQSHNIEEVKAVKQVHLNEKELLEISDLVKSEAITKLGPVYQMGCCCTDASLNLAIWVRYETVDKTISLRNFCDLNAIEHPRERYSPDFPKALSELILDVHNIRIKYALDK